MAGTLVTSTAFAASHVVADAPFEPNLPYMVDDSIQRAAIFDAEESFIITGLDTVPVESVSEACQVDVDALNLLYNRRSDESVKARWILPAESLKADICVELSVLAAMDTAYSAR